MPQATASDRAFAAFFLFALWGNATVDLFMGLDIDLRTTGWSFHATVWQAGHDFDPLFLANSAYMRWSALGTAAAFAPYYALAVPALLRGDGLGARGSRVRRYALCYAVGMGLNMTVVLGLELREWAGGTALAPRWAAHYWVPVLLYWLVPALVWRRLRREDADDDHKQA